MKASELTGPALDWAVAKCEEFDYFNHQNLARVTTSAHPWQPTINWAQGGPIIEREHIEITYMPNNIWQASVHPSLNTIDGQNPLIAAMRCYVASKLGNEVEIPKELKQ
jgi:hypothetical protein